MTPKTNEAGARPGGTIAAGRKTSVVAKAGKIAAAGKVADAEASCEPSLDLTPALRERHDGWTQERQQRFLDVLGHTGCVTDACRVAGTTTTSAYRLRRMHTQFAEAWDSALKRAGQGLLAIAYKRAVEGREMIIIRKGVEVERRIMPSDSILGQLIKRIDAAETNKDKIAGSTLTWEEWQANTRFNKWGEKCQMPDQRASETMMAERFEKVQRRLRDYAAAGGGCPCCRQKLPEGWPRSSIMEMQVLGVVNIWDNRDGWGAQGPTRTQPEPTDVFIPPLT